MIDNSNTIEINIPHLDGIDPTLEQILYHKEIILQYQKSIDDIYRIQIEKRYKDRTDVVKVDYHPEQPVSELLEWIQGALRKLNKHEI